MLLLYKLALAVAVWRLVNLLTLSTFFQADEFYQALEIAHVKVFGYGYETWEWPEQLRLLVHPAVYMVGYSLVRAVGSDRARAVVLVPKLINAMVAAVGEVALYKWVGAYHDEKTAGVALGLSLFNPFNWYVLTRSFANGFETVLTVGAMVFWPWFSEGTKRARKGTRNGSKKGEKNGSKRGEKNGSKNGSQKGEKYASNNGSKKVSKKGSKSAYKSIIPPDLGLVASLALAYLSCVIRPTNALLWAPLGLALVGRTRRRARLLAVALAVLVAVVGVCAVVDRQFYGQWTVPMANFLRFNVVNNLLVFYGTAPWHFYVGQAVPMMAMAYLPFMAVGVYLGGLSQLSVAALLVVVGFSCIDHKEIRFLLPLQPIFMYYSGVGVVATMRKRWFKPVIAAIAVANVGVAYFLGRVNERGAIAIVDYLRPVDSFAMLTPCHLTPWQSHFHDPSLHGWFLTCEPPLHVPLEGYLDESDVFYANPTKWLDENMEANWGTTSEWVFSQPLAAGKRPWPSHVVMFEALVPEVAGYFENSPYRECDRVWNSYFHWDGRRQGDLVVYCRKDGKDGK